MLKDMARVITTILICMLGVWFGQQAWISYQTQQTLENTLQIFGKGEFDQARVALEQRIVQSPNNAELHRMLGRTLNLMAVFRRDKNAQQESIRVLERCVQLDSFSAINWFELATAYTNAGQNQLAEQSYIKSLERDPRNSNYLFTFGFFYERQKKWQKAIEFYTTSLEVHQDALVQSALTRVQEML